MLTACRNRIFVMTKWGFGKRLVTGKGITVLFKGDPGTGKTLCAEIMASELGMKLYQVSIPRLVSKYVGETEKNISKIFASARANHCMLLFDEADSLFAKRTEVKSSVDRYANLEVNYLLQRIEAFSGITLLTTNLDSSIDPAVRRRLAAHVKFYAPDEGERAELWRRMLAVDAPRAADINADDLAQQFADMTGGNIKNAVIGAAFLAAAEDEWTKFA